LRLLELTSRGFRNLSPDAVSFEPGWNLVVGENGQGKTNLLEAIALLCGQRSFRRASPAEMAADGETFALEGRFRRGFATEDVGVTWVRGEGRKFRRAGKEISFREASALSPAVFLAPEHRSILAGPPEERRRFLDRLVVGWRPAAGADLVAYERALRERNALLLGLRDGRHGGSDSVAELDAWTDELATAGEAVRRHRTGALEAWNVAFSSLLQTAGKEYAGVTLSYSCGDCSDLRTTLKKLLPIERARGRSLAGPHRDDLLWSRGGRPLEGRASAGEIHRLVTLAKLAEWRVVREATGEAPLFAVDDFDAGLSPRSLERFVAGLPEGTTVVLTTASDVSRFRGLPAAVLRMTGGVSAADSPRVAASTGKGT